MMVSVQRRLIALLMSLMMLALSIPANADELLDDQINTRPTGLAMATDAVLVRPMGIVLTVAGAGLFVISLPFTLLSGSVGEAGKTLVGHPAHTTFMRCLGCTATQDEWRHQQVAEESSN